MLEKSHDHGRGTALGVGRQFASAPNCSAGHFEMRENQRTLRVFGIAQFDPDGSIRALFRCMDRETRQLAMAHLFATLPRMQEGWYGACDALVAEIDEEELELEFGAQAELLAEDLILRVQT